MSANIPTKKFSWNTAILLSLGVGLLAAGLSVFLQTQSEIMHTFLLHNMKTPAEAYAPKGSGFSFAMPENPLELIIPTIGVDAPIESVSKTSDGEMDVPENLTDVAWYKDGPRPGMPGSAVIDGHFDGKYVREAVFYTLDNLKKGDPVEVVESGGTTLTFHVVGLKTYNYNDPTADIFSGDSSASRLNLITCGGNWMENQKTYDKRTVIFTELGTTS